MIALLLSGGWFAAESLTWLTILCICAIFAVPCFLIGAIANYDPMYLEFRKTRNFFASVLFFGMLALLEFGGAPIVKTIVERPIFAGLIFLANLVVGSVYSRYRWGKLAPKLAARYNEKNQMLIKNLKEVIQSALNCLEKSPSQARHSSDDRRAEHELEHLNECCRALRHEYNCKIAQGPTKDQLTAWIGALDKTSEASISIPAGFEGALETTEKYRPDVLRYKGQIYMWVLCCAPCILWDMIFHFLWDLFDAVFGYFRAHLQALADKHVTAVNVHHEGGTEA